MQTYARLISAIVYCASGLVHTGNISLSLDNTDKGRADVWDKRRPTRVIGDRAAVDRRATLAFLILLIAALHGDHVNRYTRRDPAA